MAMVVAAQNTNGFPYARSDAEFDQHLQAAVEASNDDFAFRMQLEETLPFSNFTFAYDLQLEDMGLPHIFNPSTSTAGGASSSSFPIDDEEDYMDDYYQQHTGFGGKNAEKSNGKKVCDGLGLREFSIAAQKTVPVELCGICYEEATVDMFEGIHCLHRFCHLCMTKYIHMRLERKRHQIYCPHESCGEALNPQECRSFLPEEIMDEWSNVIVEAEIPQSQKVYCPFRDCSAMLVKEDVAGVAAEEILNAECPFCNRMFCVRCLVPWHADLDCAEYQMLPPAERSEEDRQFFKLAEARKWQRCGNCGSMIELAHGCYHIVCSCRYEFCYLCGTGWTNGKPNCICPRADENRLLQRT